MCQAAFLQTAHGWFSPNVASVQSSQPATLLLWRDTRLLVPLIADISFMIRGPVSMAILRKMPANRRHLVGGTRLELVTSTMST
jgi:hypothetical protein